MAVCIACGHEHEGIIQRCSVCSYINEAFLSPPTEEQLKEQKAEAKKYRDRLLTDVQININKYNYKNKITVSEYGPQIEAPEKGKISFSPKGIDIGQSCWYEEERFINLKCDLPLSIELEGRQSKKQVIKMRIPKPECQSDTLLIGMKLLPGMQACLVCGTKENYSVSDEVFDLYTGE